MPVDMVALPKCPNTLTTTGHTMTAAPLSAHFPQQGWSNGPPSDNSMACPPTFYQLSFPDNLKRSVNPFDVTGIIADVTKHRPKQLFSVNASSFIVELQDHTTASALQTITTIKDVPCTVSAYDPFNTSKGVIYIQEFDLSTEAAFASFKQGLLEMYDLKDASLASFIKPRTPDTFAVLLTFNSPTLPYTLYIPGERYDCRIYPFHRRPMLCTSCQRYGHTGKRCRSQTVVCRRCSTPGHSSTNCTSEAQCFHCKGPHEAGSRTCPQHVRETTLLRIQEDHKVSLQRARQLASGNSPTFLPKPHQSDHYDITFSEHDKRTFSPWSIHQSITKVLLGNPKSIRSLNKTTFTVTLSSPKQRDLLLRADRIGGFPTTITESHHGPSPRGIIYIYEYALRLSLFPSWAPPTTTCD